LSITQVISLNLLRFTIHVKDLKAFHRIVKVMDLIPDMPNYENFLKASNKAFLPIPSLSQVRAAYAQLLKEAHPDTAQEEITSAQAAQRIDQLTNAFNRVREWYRELGIAG